MKTPTLYAPDSIRGITIKQPWAACILHGDKRVENRPRAWAPGWRLLHAGSRDRPARAARPGRGPHGPRPRAAHPRGPRPRPHHRLPTPTSARRAAPGRSPTASTSTWTTSIRWRCPSRATASSAPGASRSPSTSAFSSSSPRTCTNCSRRPRHEPHRRRQPAHSHRPRSALPLPSQPHPDPLPDGAGHVRLRQRRQQRREPGSEREAAWRGARRACSGCPIVTDCLKWALVNQPLTKVGIFASTTPKQRTALRKRIVYRLGPDWIDVLADQDQARRERAAAARHTPLTVNQARIIRLDREINGPMRKPLAPAQQQRNMARLMAGLKAA